MDRLISEQAVIDAIDKWVKNMGVLIALPANEVTPLFESIHELPPVNPQPKYEDIAKAFQFGLALGFGEKHDEMDKVIDEIKKVITPEPKTGHWIVYDVHGHKACKCSECNKDVGYPCYDKYCGHCGSYNGGERI